ncbi:VOC family protein [Bacillus massiliglaciei]|uniref:VOC family protein n=1 Tax=Bacillus massiliglaciei TaxID=1816693 RepID=UPI000A4B8642|nr:VOC family protein [Bacillus massiliglaciei]
MIAEMHPYLVLNGNGKEAAAFYENALQAEIIRIQTFGELPSRRESPVSSEMKDLVLNAHLKVGNTTLMLSDTYPGQPYQIGSQVTIAIIFDEAEETKTAFKKLQEGGEILMPLQETFWSPFYGQVQDKFGITWQISTKTADPP